MDTTIWQRLDWGRALTSLRKQRECGGLRRNVIAAEAHEFVRKISAHLVPRKVHMSVTRTVTIFIGRVIVNTTAGEFLDYTLTAAGGTPAFAYDCTDRDPISRADQFSGHPKISYRWKLQTTGEILPTIVAADKSRDTYAVAMSFLGVVQYDLTINLCNPNGSVKTVVQQISYTSNDSNDSIAEGLGVTCV